MLTTTVKVVLAPLVTTGSLTILTMERSAVGVAVGVEVAVAVGVGVKVAVGVAVAVAVAVGATVAVAVAVEVAVAVGVDVAVAVAVAVAVEVGVGVGDGEEVIPSVLGPNAVGTFAPFCASTSKVYVVPGARPVTVTVPQVAAVWNTGETPSVPSAWTYSFCVVS